MGPFFNLKKSFEGWILLPSRPLTSMQETKMHKRIKADRRQEFFFFFLSSHSLIQSNIIWIKYFGNFCSFGVTLVLVVMVTGGQQQNNLLGAMSLLHRVLVHPQELSATSAFSLKTRHSRESGVPADPCCWNLLSSSGKADSMPPGETYSVSCGFVFLTRAHHAKSRKRNRMSFIYSQCPICSSY